MGNASGREEAEENGGGGGGGGYYDGDDDDDGGDGDNPAVMRSSRDDPRRPDPVRRTPSPGSSGLSPPQSPGRSLSPLMFASQLKSVRVCSPRYWPQFIELVPEEKPWWRSGDKSDPFNGGLLYIKRKVGSCSYADDPVGCQSLLSRAMHKGLVKMG